MAEFWFNDGTPRKAKELYFNDGSVRKIKEAWFNDGTGVRKVYSPFSLLTGSAGSIMNTAASTGIRTATLSLQTDGTQTGTGGSLINWGNPVIPGIGASYFVQFNVSGTNYTTSGVTLGAWTRISLVGGLSVKNSSTTTEGTGTISCVLSADGVTPLSTYTVSFDVGYTP